MFYQSKAVKGNLRMENEQQIEMVRQLLQEASKRQKDNLGETAVFNILSKLQIEWQEREHSKIIFSLLNDGYVQNGQNTFLRFFLETLKVSRRFHNEAWNVYREKAFDGGISRIDFVLESKSFCAIIEMKIEAGDGYNQLARYDSFGRKKRKEYFVYYLTIDGHRPEEQSIDGMEENRLRCISFEKEIIAWLQKCMDSVEKDGYRYSFLKQYLGAVKNMTGANDEMVNVKDLLDSADMVKAAEIVADSFYEKMYDVQAQFFKNLNAIIKKKTKLETRPYTDALYVFLSEFTHRKHTYNVTLGFEIYDELEVVIGFKQNTEDDDVYFLRLDDAENIFPRIFREWMDKIDSLDYWQKFRRYPRSRWIYVENSRGDRLNFKDNSAQIQLIEEMDLQCKFIADYITKLIIKPLTT